MELATEPIMNAEAIVAEAELFISEIKSILTTNASARGKESDPIPQNWPFGEKWCRFLMTAKPNTSRTINLF